MGYPVTSWSGHNYVNLFQFSHMYSIYHACMCPDQRNQLSYPIRVLSVKEESALLEEYFTIMLRQFQGTGRQNVHIYAYRGRNLK